MFNPKKPETSFGGAAAVEPARTTPPQSQASQPQGFSAYDRSTPPNHSIVDERLTMKGDLESEGDVLVKGKVVGNIRCKLLIIDVDALVEGGIVAEEVVVRGRSKGTIQSVKVRLEKTAVVDSEISHQSFSAEEGAKIKGSLKFMEDLPQPVNARIAAAA